MFALRIGVSLGLHRRSPVKAVGLATELDKRLFWTCYILDRELAVLMGRPVSLSDCDIDIEV
jgi:hypothetical protein